jgi:hypothetical protein
MLASKLICPHFRYGAVLHPLGNGPNCPTGQLLIQQLPFQNKMEVVVQVEKVNDAKRSVRGVPAMQDYARSKSK